MKEESHQTLEDALIHEVWRQDLDSVKRLLEAGANPNLPGGNWSSAIACAGENDETGQIIRALVAAGADVNLQDADGWTPLLIAVDSAIDGATQQDLETINWSIVAVLLDLGADPHVAHPRWGTVYDMATDYGPSARESFAKFLRSRQSFE
jgi:ankyrin repeat protein